MLAQEGDDGVEKAVYYFSKKMVGSEERYAPLGKTCWALVWASKKLRHYMLAYPFLFEKPALTGRMAQWLLMLGKFELKYVTRKFVKGRAIAEFLADYPVEGEKDVEFKFPDEDITTIAEDA
ncbi:hypothetical protein RHMOL_Rhmol06G0138100 [Rhododendron molle]|uniref:Uncharacterized protein n=1 Tax=Rhododendron molle TaxID=49168 RepID=A0ACC0NC72_RHOML|nr:hypothetical protein RHMOL_Rhmol06G0138100 [Rhododendron molle]